MKKIANTITSILGLMVLSSALTVQATESIAVQLNVYPTCTYCHTNATLDTADNGNLMSAAKAAYNQDRRGLSGLKAFLDAQLAPVATLTCTGNTVLNATKDACIAKDVISPPSVTPPATQNEMPATNTNPVLNKVATQWDAKVGEAFKIPLSVQDAEQDEFKMLASKLGVKFSKVYTDTNSQLPTIDFLWTPTTKDINKITTLTFQAKETKTTPALMSNKVSVRIRVWAAGDRNAASITKLNVSTSTFKSGKLNLSGSVVFNNLLTALERKNFIAQKLNLTVSDTSGVVLGTTILKLDAKGNWTTSMPVVSSACNIVVEFEGQQAARTVVGCIK